MAKVDEPLERLGTKEVAAYLGLASSTLRKWRMTGDGPPFHRLGKRLIFYKLADLDAWLEECSRQRPPGNSLQGATGHE